MACVLEWLQLFILTIPLNWIACDLEWPPAVYPDYSFKLDGMRFGVAPAVYPDYSFKLDVWSGSSWQLFIPTIPLNWMACVLEWPPAAYPGLLLESPSWLLVWASWRIRARVPTKQAWHLLFCQTKPLYQFASSMFNGSIHKWVSCCV
jgi:hypothetical protein